MALFGFGVQPGDNRTMGEMIYDRLAGNRRQEFYVVAPQEPKAKKARRAWFIFQREPRVRDHEGGRIVRDLLSEVNQRVIREDDWRRDQGGAAFINRRGYGVTLPDVDPGPPAYFYETPQVEIRGWPGGYYDGNGMWHDEGR
jgi:hypothetical protein